MPSAASCQCMRRALIPNGPKRLLISPYDFKWPSFLPLPTFGPSKTVVRKEHVAPASPTCKTPKELRSWVTHPLSVLTIRRTIAEEVNTLRYGKLRSIASPFVNNDRGRSHEVFLLPLELAARITLDVKDHLGVKQSCLHF